MRRGLVVGLATGFLVLAPAVTASAHPLGNFTVNHYDGLALHPHDVEVLSVVDAAEIPTAQQHDAVDRDGDGSLSVAERQRFATTGCDRVVGALRLTVGSRPAALVLDRASYVTRPGAAGLATSRLTCMSHATVDLTATTHRVRFADGYLSDRIGWREVTATADGVHLDRAPVPATSISDELRHYPNDLLAAPLDVRSADLVVQPGAGTSTVADGLRGVPGAGPIAGLVDRLDRLFSGLAGAEHLTLGVGLLAVLVSLLLGASHAALPGHGKTIMAAYLAGRRGSTRDAVVVGATVTATHTAGVLLLGLALTASSSLAGDRVLGDLGVVSGALVALIGAGLLVTAVRRRGSAGHHHEQDHGHDHGHGHHGHDHDHGHDHPHRVGRTGLVGMGIAGGLVPSPSALVVLLGAVALGRTVFGVVLVLTYGLGMAATLTAAGLLAVRLADRWSPRLARVRLAQRLSTATPVVTGGLVLVVGLGLAARSLAVV